MKIDEILNDNIGSILGRMIDTKAFWDLNKYIIYIINYMILHLNLNTTTSCIHQIVIILVTSN